MQFIEEGLGFGDHRAQVIHPQPAHESSWMPLIFAEDCYEIRKAGGGLLTYLITGRGFRDCELLADSPQQSAAALSL